jgi:class 3 adenylate cyclase
MFKFKSIKSALLLKIGLVAIVPLLTISIFNYLYFRNVSINTTQDIQTLVNQRTTTKIHLYLMLQQLLYIEASKYSGVNFNASTPKEVIAKKSLNFLKGFKSNTLFNHLLICDKNGKILAYDTGDKHKKDIVGKTLKEFQPLPTFGLLPYVSFQVGELSVEGQIAITPLVKSSLSNRLYMVGLTGLETLKSFLKEELNQMSIRNLNEGTLLLIDVKTNKIVQNVTDQATFPKDWDWNSINEKNRIIRINNQIWYADKEIILIGGNKYFLVTIVTKKDILYNSTKMLNITLFIVASALLLASLTVILIANGYVVPLRKIEEKMFKVAHSDFSGEVAVLSEDEFGRLSQSANRMSDEIQRNIKVINEEKAKSEELLLNILPVSIANRLKRKEKVISDGFSEATILFSDIVGFTTYASNLQPKELTQKLNELVSKFDDCLDKYHIEKIKTIGDALMLVSGVPEPRKDHAEEMARMAFDMLAALEEFNTENNESLQIRIGIHTGPVVAGVIGKKKFVYDLWGDSVNIASRMESHGIPSAIQVSASTYEYLKAKFILEERGTIKVKGKGDMVTYILKKEAAA